MLKRSEALVITVSYIVFGVLWIIITDGLVDRYLDDFVYYSTVKGIIFVLLSALILYYAIDYFLQKNRQLSKDLEEEKSRNLLYKETLNEQNQRFLRIVERSPLPAVLHNEANKIVAISNHIEAITGYNLKDIPTVQALIRNVFPEHHDNITAYLEDLHENKDQSYSIVLSFKNKDKKDYRFDIHSSYMGQDENDMATYLSLAVDLTDHYNDQSQLKYLTEHDDLTGLYNKRYFNQLVETRKYEAYGLILIDINSLKLINDVYGHTKGDELLQLFTSVMKKHVSKDDIVCRLGGDEFAIISSECDFEPLNDLTIMIQNDLLDSDFLDVKTTASFGIAIKTNGRNFYQTFAEAEHNLYSHKTHLLNQHNNLVLKSLMKSLFSTSDETNHHLENLNALAKPLVKSLKLSPEDEKNLELLIKIHDIGKINIPSEIFKITQSLDHEHLEIIKKHPEYGYRIANALPQLKTVAYAVLTHHENIDGSGYPFGLKDKEIPYLAKILRVLDSYETMTSGRAYKKKKTAQEAIDELKKYAGIYYDKTLVDRFVETLQKA